VTRPESALRYLLFRSFVNRLAAQVKRVRSPRYALAFLAGAAYLYYFVGRGLARGFTASSTASTGDSSAYVLAYEALLVLSAILTWVVGAAEPAIGFTRADIQMLFPAPVSRGAVVRYKLAQTQLAILFSVLVWSLLLGRVHGSQRLLRTAALWVLFTTLYLHRVGASFVKVSAAQRGLSGIRRNIVPIAIVIAALGATAWGLAHTWPAVREAAGDGRFDEVVRILRGAPAIAVVLWPFHALVSPVFAANAGAWARSIPWALLLLAGCYAWVIRSAVGFEEAAMLRADRLAAEQARRRLSRQGKLRAGRPVRALQLAGRPWPAIGITGGRQ